MIETDRLTLSLLDDNDEQAIVQWRNQQEVIENLFSWRGITTREHREWYERYLKSDSRIEFVIALRDSGRKIGTIGLSSIDYRNQKAEYGILIGEKNEWGKGYAKEASRSIIDYGFKELNLQKIYLKVFTSNINAISLYKKLGFKQEGILRKEIFKNGQFKDVAVMAVLKDEWTCQESV